MLLDIIQDFGNPRISCAHNGAAFLVQQLHFLNAGSKRCVSTPEKDYSDSAIAKLIPASRILQSVVLALTPRVDYQLTPTDIAVLLPRLAPSQSILAHLALPLERAALLIQL